VSWPIFGVQRGVMIIIAPLRHKPKLTLVFVHGGLTPARGEDMLSP